MGAGFAAGFLAYRLHSDRPAPLQPLPTTTPAQTGPPEAGTAGSATPAAIPATLPDLSLPDLAGAPRSLRSFIGAPLILNFWATWCAPCRREIPLLRELRLRHRADRLEVVGIAVDFRTAVTQYLRHTPIDYPVLIGEQGGLEAEQQFGMQGVLPFSVFVDRRGRIVALKVGELHRPEALFILERIQALDEGRSSMPEARRSIEERLKSLAVERAKAQQNGH